MGVRSNMDVDYLILSIVFYIWHYCRQSSKSTTVRVLMGWVQSDGLKLFTTVSVSLICVHRPYVVYDTCKWYMSYRYVVHFTWRSGERKSCELEPEIVNIRSVTIYLLAGGGERETISKIITTGARMMIG